MLVSNNDEFGKALKRGENCIEVEIGSKLGNTITRIQITGPVAWGVCIAALAVAVVAILAAPATGGASAMLGVAAAPGAVAVLGPAVTASAISIAVAGGGIGALNKLRKYKMEKKDGKIILRKK